MSSSSPLVPGAILTTAASSEARFFASSVASWYLATLDPHAPHCQNVESRLRHPVHVVTRRILYGNVQVVDVAHFQGGEAELEMIYNDDDAEIKDAGPKTLTRRTAARMEAFLASCSLALREDHDVENIRPKPMNGGTKTEEKARKNKTRIAMFNNVEESLTRAIPSYSNINPKTFQQIDQIDLIRRLELYCRTLRRIRSIMDAQCIHEVEECVIQYESRKSIRSRVGLILQTYLRTVDCVRDVHKTLMSLILKATLEVLAEEVCSEDLRGTIDRLIFEYEHKVSFASLAFLSSPDSSVETYLAPLLVNYFEYIQKNWQSLISQCELERMLLTVLDEDMRQFFRNAVFHSVGHILDVCRSYRESLDNIALPPPWKEGVLGVERCSSSLDVDAAIQKYCSDPALVKQALRDLRREVITVNGHILSPASSSMELAENLGSILNSEHLMYSLSPKGRRKSRKAKKKSCFTSDFGLEEETEFGDSGVDSDGNTVNKIDLRIMDVLTRRLLIAASRTGAGGDAYFIVRDLFGGEEVEVIPNQSERTNQGTIEIIVKRNAVIIKSHAKFDIIPKPFESNTNALIQFHTTTTETISLLQDVEAGVTVLKEKKTDMTGWRTLAIRPAFYKKVLRSR